MLRYIYGHDETVAQFVASLIPSCAERGLPKASKAIGVVDEDGLLIAGFVYHNYDPDAGVIEISIASLPGRRWLTPETLRHLYQFPFLQCGCQLVLGRVAASNERLLRQMAVLNYTFITIPRLLGRDADAVLCLLTREAWEASKFNQRYRHDAGPQQLHEAA